MAKEEGSHSEMAHARWSDGINVIFDQNSPASLRSCSRSSSGSGSNRSAESDQHRALGHRKRHYRSSSSSSSRSRSTPRTRSRSRPRCNRPSSRCRCDNHHRHRRAHHRRSHAHRVRAHPRSVSRSPSPDRYSHRRSNRSRSSSNSHKKRHQRTVGRFDSRVSRSPVDSYRSHSRSGSSSSSLSLSLEDKQELLVAAKTIATKSLDVEHLQLPESVQPILLEVIESQRRSSKPETRVRQGPERTASQEKNRIANRRHSYWTSLLKIINTCGSTSSKVKCLHVTVDTHEFSAVFNFLSCVNLWTSKGTHILSCIYSCLHR
ncbi:arginine/serine-rich protein 1 isoform X1 [Solea solea]|uniref:arginine/serine-rich protein 1 isoform X1 n=1 Tax=Solea solea TaxID=90069 RepID=UPI00272CE8F1|nr:arginine/serine-rich protein 1 isoform X1 [Solea solea]